MSFFSFRLCLFLVLLFPLTVAGVGHPNTVGTTPRTDPFSPRASLLRHWSRLFPTTPIPAFLLAKASPLNATQVSTFYRLFESRDNDLTTRLPSFCTAAHLYCHLPPTATSANFSTLAAGAAPPASNTDFDGYRNRHFSLYGTGKKGGPRDFSRDYFKNYSTGTSVSRDSFSTYGPNTVGRREHFTSYTSSSNVAGSGFQSYTRGATGGSSEFNSYGSPGNVQRQDFTKYGNAASGGTQRFASYSEGANTATSGFTSYGTGANNGATDFAGYANASASNMVTNKFESYDDTANGATGAFSAYSAGASVGKSVFKAYNGGGNGGNEEFTAYGGERSGQPENVFAVYGRRTNDPYERFSSYGESTSSSRNEFREYNRDASGSANAMFVTYFDEPGRNVTSFKDYFRTTATFEDYRNSSSTTTTAANLISTSTITIATTNDGNVSNTTLHSHWPLAVEPGKFFRRSTLTVGSNIPFPDIRDRTPPRSFLPRQLAMLLLPFSSSDVSFLARTFGDSMTLALSQTLRECENPPSKGELKRCVTSLEDMATFASSVLGSSATASTTSSTAGSGQIVQVRSVKPRNGGNETRSVSCHQSLFPYLVYYCHMVPRVMVYDAELTVGPGGSGAANGTAESQALNRAVAICHMDTSQWGPRHAAFLALGPGPGKIEVCHFIFENDLVWVAAAP